MSSDVLGMLLRHGEVGRLVDATKDNASIRLDLLIRIGGSPEGASFLKKEQRLDELMTTLDAAEFRTSLVSNLETLVHQPDLLEALLEHDYYDRLTALIEAQSHERTRSSLRTSFLSSQAVSAAVAFGPDGPLALARCRALADRTGLPP